LVKDFDFKLGNYLFRVGGGYDFTKVKDAFDLVATGPNVDGGYVCETVGRPLNSRSVINA
jgi:hypothetical protein